MTHRGGRESFSKCYSLPAAHQVHLRRKARQWRKAIPLQRSLRNEERQRKEKLTRIFTRPLDEVGTWTLVATERTDHDPLVHLLAGDGTTKSPRLPRVASKLQIYDYTVEYVSGNSGRHRQADGLPLGKIQGSMAVDEDSDVVAMFEHVEGNFMAQGGVVLQEEWVKEMIMIWCWLGNFWRKVGLKKRI
ncbi:hypothetical protein NDU88_002207 [Pleurodeles waltl]|uniref:Uncharacterized protein n=1 Tax=Pleurodeles waltl TaxID=8319 RepID=A0AAV7UWB8_PLEWA|nr:hypothetical protein NDU88_002207 [Pleurodeles waltl]